MHYDRLVRLTYIGEQAWVRYLVHSALIVKQQVVFINYPFLTFAVLHKQILVFLALFVYVGMNLILLLFTFLGFTLPGELPLLSAFVAGDVFLLLIFLIGLCEYGSLICASALLGSSVPSCRRCVRIKDPQNHFWTCWVFTGPSHIIPCHTSLELAIFSLI
jgi:hypothetical protein